MSVYRIIGPVDQLPRLGKRELICLLLFTCNYVVSVGEVSSSCGCLGWATLLAHLSQRLIGELIRYHGQSSLSVVRQSTISNVFSSEIAWPIKAKFHVEHPWQGGKKVYINGTGHMIKMTATPIYAENLKKSSPEPEVL